MYPHIAIVSTVLSSSKDANGDWSSVPSSTVSIQCRMELNTKNKFLSMADGKRVDYSATVYMPLGIDIPAGAKIKVQSNGVTQIDTTVKQFFKGQLNQRLWL